MQLSLHADYSCRVLIYLATSKGRCSIEDIAASFDISKNHLVKVVHQLGKLGYIKTVRGRGGGIQLNYDPEKLSIGAVIRDTEANLDIVECFNQGTSRCPINNACGLKPWLGKAIDAFLKTLDQVSLADIVKNRRKLSSSLQIVSHL